MQAIGTCRLCQNERPLQNKSHIIPEFMYESLFDADHKALVFSPSERLQGKGIVQRPSTGEYKVEYFAKNVITKPSANMKHTRASFYTVEIARVSAKS